MDPLFVQQQLGHEHASTTSLYTPPEPGAKLASVHDGPDKGLVRQLARWHHLRLIRAQADDRDSAFNSYAGAKQIITDSTQAHGI